MKSELRTRRLVITGLFTALVTATTLFPHIPTPTMGYIHAGDAMVLLSGILLGPAFGSFAGGVGSALADLLTGYSTFAPGTLVIKALTAAMAGYLFKTFSRNGNKTPLLILSGTISEAFMVFGYFLYESLLMTANAGGFSASAFTAGMLTALSSIPLNLVQGGFGVVLSLVLYPYLHPLMVRAFTDSSK